MTPEQLEELNHTAYSYRCAPITNQKEVVERFEDLVSYVQKLIDEARAD
jgi:predicted nucleic acid-binding Zn ribbon protein